MQPVDTVHFRAKPVDLLGFEQVGAARSPNRFYLQAVKQSVGLVVAKSECTRDGWEAAAREAIQARLDDLLLRDSRQTASGVRSMDVASGCACPGREHHLQQRPELLVVANLGLQTRLHDL